MMTWWRQRFYLYLVDHGFLRLLFSNFHELPGGLYRANQPSPGDLRRYKKRFGIKTVINLRGGDEGNLAWQLESEECARLGIALINLRIFSRSLPYKEDLEKIREVISSAHYPALVHCKSGADRAGFFCVLYRIYRLGEPVENAMSELSFRFGHFSAAETGILDYFFRAYLSNRAISGVDFDYWVRETYDRAGLREERPRFGIIRSVANFVVNRVLRRE